MDKIINVKYVPGSGKASIVAVREDRRALFKRLFNCQLYGTVNVREKSVVQEADISPCITEGIHKFYLVSLRDKASGNIEYGWMYEWDGSKMSGRVREIYFKTMIDDQFKAGDIEMTIYNRWSPEKIKAWQKGKYWFQTFEWASPESVRADSKLVWDQMRGEDYANKTVLDFGCNYGFYSFSAAKQGAVVEGVELKASDLVMAECIRHIEMTDAKFTNSSEIPEKTFDYIFELSVFHWIDADYSHLGEHVDLLKSRGKVIFLELINPPLKRGLTQQQVDELVGGEKLIHYKHKVRRMRTLYKIRGDV